MSFTKHRTAITTKSKFDAEVKSVRIYKYPVGTMPGKCYIKAPFVKVLGVSLDANENPFLYAIVDPNKGYNDDDTIYISTVWTGEEFGEFTAQCKYLSTLTVGGLVCHYFAHGGRKGVLVGA